jgi:hypothetical protein
VHVADQRSAREVDHDVGGLDDLAVVDVGVRVPRRLTLVLGRAAHQAGDPVPLTLQGSGQVGAEEPRRAGDDDVQ